MFDVILPELIYCGQRLLDGKALSSYGVKEGSTVYVLQKKIKCADSGTLITATMKNQTERFYERDQPIVTSRICDVTIGWSLS